MLSGKRVECLYVTNERISEWKNSNNPKKLNIAVDPSRFVYELCWAIVRGDFSHSKCRIALESANLLGNNSILSFDEISNTMADVIAHMGQEFSSPSETRSKLIELSKWLTNTQLIPTKLLQERCEEEFLYEAGMIKMDANEFKKKIVRINTRLIYTQTKFNLLREESEGYAKLCTILNQTGNDELKKNSSAFVIDSIKSLIGYFDLDPNRVFDIIMDSFEMQPNNDAFFDLIPLFPKSHTAHILGFKFQNYLNFEDSEKKKFIPNSLFIVTVKLIKNNFISLDSIYPHLGSDDDEEIEKFETEKEKRMKEVNKIGQINLAATGADLNSEEIQVNESQIDFFSCIDNEENFVKIREEDMKRNLKVKLLMHMLEEGDWENAKILFSKLKKINPISYHPISNALFKLIHKCIETNFKISQPKFIHKKQKFEISNSNSKGFETLSFFSVPFSQKTHPKLSKTEIKTAEVSRFAIQTSEESKFETFNPETSKPETKFFEESKIETSGFGMAKNENNLSNGLDSAIILKPKQEKLLCNELLEMLKVIGPYMYRDLKLLQKICRILKFEFSKAEKNEIEKIQIQNYISSIMEYSFLPSLRLISANPPICIQIWQLLEFIPFEVRYRLYGEWESDKEKIPVLIAAKQIAKLDTRRVLKRLAKENLKPTGRILAKLAHSNPLIVLRTIVVQIEAYKEMINPVVESFKYFNQLEFDILEYVVIERLSVKRKKIKDDGLNVSDWLQCLASFWGTVCKKYPSMELKGLFQYLFNQLMQNEGSDIILLQELIQQMASIEFEENLNDEQISSLSGGEILKQNFFNFGQQKNNKALSKSIARLRDALLPKEEKKLAFPLLVLIAHQRSNSIFSGGDSMPIKIVSQKFDFYHSILMQYVDFLYNSVSPVQVYAQIIPSLKDLVQTYNISPEIAFHIYRPIFRLFKSKKSNQFWPMDETSTENNNTKIENNSNNTTEILKIANSEGNQSNNSADKTNDQIADVAQSNLQSDFDEDSNLVLDFGNSQKPSITWSSVIESVKSFFPSKIWNGISPKFYILFWSLNLSDLQFPQNTYEKEINKLKMQMKMIEESDENSVQALQKRKKEKDRIADIIDKLNLEYSKQKNLVHSVNKKLKKEKKSYLSSCSPWQIMPKFLQFCLIPRCLLSIQDAVYCVRFIEKLHEIETPNFSTVQGIDVFVCRILLPLLCSCTENEAGRLGIFLLELLTLIHKWKNDENLYNQCCLNKPGFLSGFNKNSSSMTYQDFRKVNWKWNGLLLKIAVSCLESSEYIEIRNVLTLLSKIYTVFPTNRNGGIRVEKKVLKLRNEERQDLKLLATSVSASLASRKNFWVSDDEFGGSPPSIPKPPSMTTAAPSLSKAEVSKKFPVDPSLPSKGKSTLSPSAPPFVPPLPKSTQSEKGKIQTNESSPGVTNTTSAHTEMIYERSSHQTVKSSQIQVELLDKDAKISSSSPLPLPLRPVLPPFLPSPRPSATSSVSPSNDSAMQTYDANKHVRTHNEPKESGSSEPNAEVLAMVGKVSSEENKMKKAMMVKEEKRKDGELNDVIRDGEEKNKNSNLIKEAKEGEGEKVQEKVFNRVRGVMTVRERMSVEEKEERGEKDRERGGREEDREREKEREKERGRDRERERDAKFRHGVREEGMRTDYLKEMKQEKLFHSFHDDHPSYLPPHPSHPHSQTYSAFKMGMEKGEGKRLHEEGEEREKEKAELMSERIGKRVRREGEGSLNENEEIGKGEGRMVERMYKEIESRREGKGKGEEREKEREERGREREKREKKERSLSRESRGERNSKEREKEREREREGKGRMEKSGVEGKREGEKMEKGRREEEKDMDEIQRDWKEKDMEREKEKKGKGDTEEKDERLLRQEDGMKRGEKDMFKNEIHYSTKKMYERGGREEDMKEGRMMRRREEEMGILSFSDEKRMGILSFPDEKNLNKNQSSSFFSSPSSMAAKREEEREEEKGRKREEEKRGMKPFSSVKSSSSPSPSSPSSSFSKMREERMGEGRRMVSDVAMASGAGEDGMMRKKRLMMDEEIKEKIKREREEKEERERDREWEKEREREREIMLARREWGDRDKTDKTKSILSNPTIKDEMVSEMNPASLLSKRRKLRREGILEPSPSYATPLPPPPPPPPLSHPLSPPRAHLVSYEPRDEVRRKSASELGMARNRISYDENYVGNRAVNNNSRFYGKGVRGGLRGEEVVYEMEDMEDARGRMRGDRKRHGDARRH